MSRLKQNLQMYWPTLVGVLLFIPAAWQYYSLGMWEKYVADAALGLLAFVCVLAPEEVSSWTGRYGWTYDSFWTYPATYVRFFGFTMQIWVLLFGFR